jgi:hypothetical protein
MRLKTLLTFTFALTLLVACGDRERGTKKPTPQPGETFPLKGKELDSQSLSVAYRICNAFRSKRNYWHMSGIIGKNAKLNLEYRGCNSSYIENYSVDSVISAPTLSSPITFASLSTEDYHKNVETDANGYLSESCRDILSGENVDEYYTIQLSSHRIYTQFQNVDETTDRVHIKEARPVRNESGIITEFESISVISLEVKTSGVEDKLIGTVPTMKETRACESGADRYMTQILESIL